MGRRIATAALLSVLAALGVTYPAQGAEPQSNAARHIEIPLFALLYKYAPQSLDDDFLTRRARRQIAIDQNQYDNPTKSGWIFMFAESEVKDRDTRFAATDLLPLYKERLAELAAGIPPVLTYSVTTTLSNIEHKDGALRQVEGRGAGPDVLVPGNVAYDSLKLRMPPMGSREVLNGPPDLMAPYPPRGLPVSVTERRPPGNVYLALDRDPSIPPLAIDRGVAEGLYQKDKLDCSTNLLEYRRQGHSIIEAQRLRDECMAKARDYKPQLRAEFDIRIEEVKVVQGGWAVYAALKEARLYGSREELLKTYPPDAFAPGVDVWQARAQQQIEKRHKEQEAAAREKAERQAALQAERERKEQIREGLAGADVIGIRLGMTLEEAEAITRKEMAVGWVAEWKGGSEHAYDGFRAYFREDGRELVTLYTHPEMSDKVLAVGRVLRLAEGTRDEDIVASLKEKYGTDAIEGDQMAATAVWASRVPAAGPWKNAGKDIQWNRSPCNLQFGASFGLFSRSITIVEGDEHARPKDGFVIRGFRPNANTKKAEEWGQCGTSVLASISLQLDGSTKYKVLRYFLADLSSYKDFYLKSQAQPSAGAAPPKL